MMSTTITDLDYALNCASVEIDTTNARAELSQLRGDVDTFRDLLVYLNAASAKDAYSAVIMLSANLEQEATIRHDLVIKNAAQACRLEEAHDLLDICLSFIVNRFDDFDFEAFKESYGHEHSIKILIDDIRAWLAANAPAHDDHTDLQFEIGGELS